jgi:class 3 adenylate cyclase
MDDARVVLDAVDSAHAAIIGDTEGGPMAMLLAASHPERAAALVLVNTFARIARAPDYRIGLTEVTRRRLVEGWRREWGTGNILDLTAPSLADDPRQRAWLGRYQRLSMAPQQAELAYRWVLDVDVRCVLPTIQAPTLVIQRQRNRYYRLAYGRFLAEHVPGARLVELPGADAYPFHADAEPVLAEIEAFLTGVRPVPRTSRVLATVLFTDIVDSTGLASRLGDERWSTLRAAHDDLVSDVIARYGGREIKSTGDGVLATFDGPGRALRGAREIVDRVRELGIEVRSGVHTGEIELVGNDIAGIGVHIAARVMSAAAPSSVWSTGTVRDLVTGSGIEFAARGEHALKGVPGRWSLYEVVPGSA